MPEVTTEPESILRAVAAGSITGNVKGRLTATTTSNLAGVTVNASKTGTPSAGVRADVGTTVTDAKGNYSLSGLNPGEYVLQFNTTAAGNWVTEWWNNTTSYDPTSTVKVVAGSITKANAELARGGTMSGTVVADEEPSVALAGVTVALFGADGRWVKSAVTNTAGAYSVVGLAGGSYRVNFEAEHGANFAPEWNGNKKSLASSAVTKVVAGKALNGVNARLSRGASIAGKVVEDSTAGTAMDWVMVSAWDSAGVEQGWDYTAKDGTFTIVGLAAGKYRLQFNDDAQSKFQTEWSGNTQSMNTSTAITVSARQAVGGKNATLSKKLTAAPVPTISGTTLRAGQTLTAKTGTWAPGAVTLAVQWKRDGVAISKATASTYKLVSADAGKKITVTVTGRKTGYWYQSKTSAAKIIEKPLTATATPTITGTLKAGSTLLAKAGVWSPAPVTLKYQWKRNGAAISGKTASTYVLVTADAGQKITVTVSGSKSGFTGITKTSSAKTINKVLTTTPVPTVSGTTKVGSTLTAKAGTWKPTGVTLKYQWKRNGTSIAGKTGTTYKLAAADKGKKVTVVVTGSKSGYTSVARTSIPKTIS
ncbi:MAG: hypothetical protein JWQ43_3698 [Glaciihabitans sp.]|nr:hypothetical protein [Glaciihabitans sp.]